MFYSRQGRVSLTLGIVTVLAGFLSGCGGGGLPTFVFVNVPATVLEETAVTVSVQAVSGGRGPVIYRWASSCGGVFTPNPSPPIDSGVTHSAVWETPAVAQDTPCIVTVTATGRGRFNTAARNTTVLRIPFVTSTAPLANETEVPVTADIIVTFDGPMASDTLTLTCLGEASGECNLVISPPTMAAANTIATFNVNDPDASLSSGLESNETYTIQINGSSLAGVPMLTPYSWSFTTSSGPPSQAPRVIFTVPANEETDVAVTTDITVIFSHPMNSATLVLICISEASGACNVNFFGPVMSNNNTTATWVVNDPDAPDPNNLEASETYRLQVYGSSLEGVAMAVPFEWFFTTTGATFGFTPCLLSIETIEGFTPQLNDGGIAIGDVNEDGLVDLVLTSVYVYLTPGKVALLLGQGGCVFGEVVGNEGTVLRVRPNRVLTAGSTPVDVALGDLDEDGHLDIVVVNKASEITPYLSIFFGDGSGNFPRSQNLVLGDLRPQHVKLADLNKDGHLDILIGAGFGVDTLVWLLGDGLGNFGAPSSFFFGAALMMGFGLNDFNNDGNLDVVATFRSPEIPYWPEPGSYRLMFLLFGDGNGNFGNQISYRLYPEAPYHGLDTGDFNGDGNADVALTLWGSEYRQNFRVYPGNGAGELGTPTDWPTGTPYSRLLKAADFNNDGHLDIVITQEARLLNESAGIHVTLGDGLGTFASPIFSPAGPGYLMLVPGDIALGDVDNDGDLDIISPTGSHYVTIWLNSLR